MTGVDDTGVVGLADRLWQAEVDRTPIPPITALRPDLTVEDAYAIQTHNVERRVAAGAVVRGRKLGRTSRRAAGRPRRRRARLRGAARTTCSSTTATRCRSSCFVQPRVEAEMAFVMATDLAGPGVTIADALTAVAGVLPAIEVVDSRIADWRFRLVDTVADNASAGRVVLGGRITPVAALDLRLLGVLLYRNGVPIDSGAGAAVLGNPARCVAWLANKLGALGRGLRRGDIVLAGPLHRMVPVRPGDDFQAEFAHLGAVTVQFSGGSAA